MCMALTGCSDYILPETTYEGLKESLATRISANLEILTDMKNSGLLSDTDYAMLSASIRDSANLLLQQVESGNIERYTALGGAISSWRVIEPHVGQLFDSNNDGVDDSFTVDSLGLSYFTNQIVYGALAGYQIPLSTKFRNGGPDGYTYTDSGTTAIAPGTDNYSTSMLLVGNNTIRGNFNGDVDQAKLVFKNVEDRIAIFKEGSRINPLTIVNPVDDTTLKNDNSWINRMAYEIWVLDSSKVSNLSEVMNAISEAQELDVINSQQVEGAIPADVTKKLDEYFTPLKDGSDTVKLFDLTDKNNQLITLSKSHGLVNDGYNAVLDESDPNNITVKSEGWITATNKTNKAIIDTALAFNYPGHDLVIRQDNQAVMSLKVYDFNQDFWYQMKDILSLSDGTYWLIDAKDTDSSDTASIGGRAYLMQYDIGYVEGYTVDTEANSFRANIVRADDMYINLMTGRVGKRVSTSAGNNHYKITNDQDERVYVLKGKDASSFVVYGETGVSEDNTNREIWNLTFGLKPGDISVSSKAEGRVKASIPRIVLTDYLECVYSPGVITDERLVAYGRMVRLGQENPENKNEYTFDGSLNSTKIGEYIDINGEGTGESLYLHELLDTEAILGKKEIDKNKLLNIPYIKKLPGEGQGLSDDGTEDDIVDALKSETYVPDNIDDLKWVVVDSIDSYIKFPSDDIAKIDYNDEIDYSVPEEYPEYVTDKPIFYGMVINKNMGSSGLIRYIINEDDSAESTRWWNLWLDNHSFGYEIPGDETLNYLQNNYSFEAGQNGIVTLNLETIAKIQDDFDYRDQEETSRAIRTVFKILGYTLVCYGIIMILAWALDTNVDFGFSILEKMTFGHMVAISNSSEIPKDVTGKDKKRYVDLGDTAVSALIIMCAGIVLIITDVMSLVVMLVNSIGKLSNYVELLFGR